MARRVRLAAASRRHLNRAAVNDGTGRTITLNTTPTDYFLVKQGQLAKFTGTQWQGFGEVLSTGA
jgi:hypothetical protein